jgi:hypothetical protein
MPKDPIHTFQFLPAIKKTDGSNWYPGAFENAHKNVTNSNVFNHRIESIEEVKAGQKVVNQYCLPSHYLPQLVCLEYSAESNPEWNPFNLYFGEPLGFKFIGNGRPLMYICDEGSELRLDGNRGIAGISRVIKGGAFPLSFGPNWAVPNPNTIPAAIRGKGGQKGDFMYYQGIDRITRFNNDSLWTTNVYNPDNTGIPSEVNEYLLGKGGAPWKSEPDRLCFGYRFWCGDTVNYYVWSYWNRILEVKEKLLADNIPDFYSPPIKVSGNINVGSTSKSFSGTSSAYSSMGPGNFSNSGSKDHRWAFYYPEDVLMKEQIMPDGTKMIDPYANNTVIQPYHISPGDIVFWCSATADVGRVQASKISGSGAPTTHIGFATGAHKLLIKMHHEDPVKRAAFSGEALILELTVEPWKEKLIHSVFPYTIRTDMIRPWKYLDRARPLFGPKGNNFLGPNGEDSGQSRTYGHILPTSQQNPLINSSYPEWGNKYYVPLSPWSYIKEFRGSGYTQGDILVPKDFGTEVGFNYTGGKTGRGANYDLAKYDLHAVANFRLQVDSVGPNTYKTAAGVETGAATTVQSSVLTYTVLGGTVGVPTCYETIEGNTNMNQSSNGGSMFCKFTRSLHTGIEDNAPCAAFMTYIGNIDGSKPGVCQIGIPRT